MAKKKKDNTLLFVIGGAAVAGLAWWWLSQPKATVTSPVYRVVTQGQTVSPLAASVTAAAGAAAAGRSSSAGDPFLPALGSAEQGAAGGGRFDVR